MSYQTYTTEALVCGAYDSNTADKSYLLFTRRAGMLYATARSVREERSKQRYALQLFSRITISLVRGKSGWRIGSVESYGNFFSEASERATRGSIVSIVKLLRQYVHGEESHPMLYDEAVDGIRHLQTLSSEATRIPWELFIKVRILNQLGYIAPSPAVASLLSMPLATVSDVDLSQQQSTFETLLARAKEASHLTQ